MNRTITTAAIIHVWTLAWWAPTENMRGHGIYIGAGILILAAILVLLLRSFRQCIGRVSVVKEQTRPQEAW